MYVNEKLSSSMFLNQTPHIAPPNAALMSVDKETDFRFPMDSRSQIAMMIFNCSTAGVAIIVSFAIGCITSIDNLRAQLKHPVSLIIGFCCQFIFMPVMAFGIAMLLNLNNEIRFGLLCVACVPGGGMGHLAAIVAKTDIPLSLTMNMISVVAMLGTAPLWIFVLGQYFIPNGSLKVIPIYNFEIWLAAIFFSYTTGLVIKYLKECLADGIITWMVRPLLLLVGILFVTLGVYINMYVFEGANISVIMGAILLPSTAFIIGYGSAFAMRQRENFRRSIALETSSTNCFIVLVALRFSLPTRDAHYASVIPLWVTFTTPCLYMSLVILRTMKNCVSGFLNSQKEKQLKRFTLASGLVNQANMTTLSAPLFIGESHDDDGNSADKITAL